MVSENIKPYTFRVKCPSAQRVYLVGEFNNPCTSWTVMQQVEPDVWEVTLHLPPSHYRYRYYAMLGRSVMLWTTIDAALGLRPEHAVDFDRVQEQQPQREEADVEAAPIAAIAGAA